MMDLVINTIKPIKTTPDSEKIKTMILAPTDLGRMSPSPTVNNDTVQKYNAFP